MKKHHKTYSVIALLLVISSISIMAQQIQNRANDFTNLQILPKNISPEKLELEMELYSRALGVECGFCHVKNGEEMDFASDKNKHKEEARDMMRMTNELNEKYFGVNLKDPDEAPVMTCYTCHRGEEFPIIPWDTAHVKPMPKLP